MERIWTIVVILGPILLGAAILWAIAHNRSSRAEIARSERATRELYDEENRRDRAQEKE